MNFYKIAHKIRDGRKSSKRAQLMVLENKDHVLLLSDYTGDEFIRITNKNYHDIYYFRPFLKPDWNEFKQRMTQAGFRRFLDD